MASASEIQTIARNIRGDAPHLGMGATLSQNMRTQLRELATDAGLPRGLKANDADLISIYLVALKDGEAAKRTAQKVAMRLDDTLLGAPSEPAAPTPRPEPPTAPQGPSLEAVMNDVRRLVAERVSAASGALGRDIEAMGKDTDERLGKLASELNSVRSALRDDIADIALSAAKEALKSLTPTRLEIVRPGEPTAHPLGLVHRDTAKIINALQAGVNVYLHGPAGSGKTTVAKKCAEAFGLQFYFAGKCDSEYVLLGFKDARGETVRTAFRECYEFGGVGLFDEFDAWSPSAVVAMNAALANGICAFPDGIVQRHKDFYCVAAGNTKLTGANRQYVGRNQLDAASIDRFSFIEFGYDDDLERAIATDQDWCAYVQGVRRAIAERGLSHLVTPRATYDGCKLLAAGFDRETVKAMCVYKGLDADTVAQIERAVRGA